MARLTAKKRLFAHEYLVDLNGTKAAIRAGFAKTRARQTAHELLNEPAVATLIKKLKEDRIARTDLDASIVLKDLQEYRAADLRELYNENGCLKSIHEWPEFFTRLGVVSIKTKEEYEDDEDGKRVLIGYVHEVKWENKTKVLELIGKHINVNAWRETKELEVSEPLKDLYRELMGAGLRPNEAPGISGGRNAAAGLPPDDNAPQAFRPRED